MIQASIDNAFIKGNSHNICEDYSFVCPIDDDLFFISVADGCSSQKNSDVGSRLLTLLAKEVVIQIKQFIKVLLKSDEYLCLDTKDFISLHSLQNIFYYRMRDRLNDNELCKKNINMLYSTLSIAVVSKKMKNAVVFLYGDGSIYCKNNNESKFIDIFYNGNAPYYLVYPCFLQERFGQKDISITKNTYVFNDISEITNHDVSPDIEVKNIFLKYADDLPYAFTCFMFEDIKELVLVTDGIHSFQSKEWGKNYEDITCYNIFEKLFGYKNTNGEFIKRQSNIINKFINKENIVHQDDISFSAISLREL